jgi:hypothetical protein
MQDSDDSDEDALRIHIEENEEDRDDFGNPQEERITETVDNVDDKDGRSLADDSEDSDNEEVVENGNRSPEQQDESNDEEKEDRKRGRHEDEDIQSSDDDLDVPLIRTKRARQLVLDDDDDE